MISIAILGANGHIGKGLIAEFAGRPGYALDLYARRPDAVTAFLEQDGLAAGPAAGRFRVLPLDVFGREPADVVINAVGLGDPVRVRAQSAAFFRATERTDNAVLDFLDRNPAALYVFLSSGAVYGKEFARPGDGDSVLALPVNRPDPMMFYGLAKYHAECKHRAQAGHNIVDIRVFGYMSRFIDLDGRLFLAELARALTTGQVFVTAPGDMVRDYAGPAELADLIVCCIAALRDGCGPRPLNLALDLRTLAPVGKFEILEALKTGHGLRYEVRDNAEFINATGAKPNYCSVYDGAAAVGYRAGRDSLAVVLDALVRLAADHARRIAGAQAITGDG